MGRIQAPPPGVPAKAGRRQLKRLLLAGAFLLSACGRFRSGADEDVQSDETVEYGVYEDPGKLFSLEVPINWKPIVDKEMRTKNISFLLLAYKPGGSKVKTLYSFSVYYYERGNQTFRTVNEYISVNRARIQDWTNTPTEEVSLKSGKGKRWTRTTTHLEDVTTDSYVVLPASSGFFVFTYSADDALHARHLPEFEHLLQSVSIGPKA